LVRTNKWKVVEWVFVNYGSENFKSVDEFNLFVKIEQNKGDLTLRPTYSLPCATDNIIEGK